MLKSDTSLPPVNRTSETEHRWLYRDVRFFHGAVQFSLFVLTVIFQVNLG